MLTVKIGEKEYSIPDGITVIGRGEDADIVIKPSKLSRTHARFSVNADKVDIEDLGSKNGTFVNGKRIEGKNGLIKGDRIRLADIECSIVFPKSPAQPASLPKNPELRPQKTVQRLGRKQKRTIKNIVIYTILLIAGLIIYSQVKNYIPEDRKKARVLVEDACSMISSCEISKEIEKNVKLKNDLEVLKKRLSGIPQQYIEECGRAKDLILEIEETLQEIERKNAALYAAQDMSTRYDGIVTGLEKGSLSYPEAIRGLEQLMAVCPGTEPAEKAKSKIVHLQRVVSEQERKTLGKDLAEAQDLAGALEFSKALKVIAESTDREYHYLSPGDADKLQELKKEIIRKADNHCKGLAEKAVNEAYTGDCSQLKEKLRNEFDRIDITEFESMLNTALHRIDSINADRMAKAMQELEKELRDADKLTRQRMYRQVDSLYENSLTKISEQGLRKEIEHKMRENSLYQHAKESIIKLVNEKGGIEVPGFGFLKAADERSVQLKMEGRILPLEWDKIRDAEFLMLTRRAASRFNDAGLFFFCALSYFRRGDPGLGDEYISKVAAVSSKLRNEWPDIFLKYDERTAQRIDERKKEKEQSERLNAVPAPASEKLSAVPTFHCIGLYWSPPEGAENVECEVLFRKTGDKAWRKGSSPWFDPRNKEYRGSLVYLEPDTRYEIVLGLAGTKTKRVTVCRTWNERFPVTKTVFLKETTDKTLMLRQSGKPDGYILYTYEPGKSTIIDGKNSIDNCIEVYGSYVIIRGLTLKNPRKNGIELFDGVHDVIIEECDVSGWGQNEADGWGINYRSAVFANDDPGIRRIIVQRNRFHHPRSDANNWKEYRKERETYHPRGPQAICLFETGGNHVFRYNEAWSDNEHRYNDIFGAGSNFSTRGFPHRDSDIYGNYLADCWDDAIESEGANCNVRIWGNYIERAMVKIATAGTSVGPLYIWRNVTGAGREHDLKPWDEVDHGAFLKTSDVMGGGRIYVFHNTLLQPAPLKGAAYSLGCSIAMGAGGPMKNITSRNNIFHICRTGGTILKERGKDPAGDYDYDMYNGRINAASGNEKHGLQRTPSYKQEPYFDRETGKGVFMLKPSTGGLDAGVIIFNFNDDFKGKGPDIGAHEYGTPPMEFGVNAYLDIPGE